MFKNRLVLSAVVIGLTASLEALADEPTVHVTTYEYVEQSQNAAVHTEYREWSPPVLTDEGWQPGYAWVRETARGNSRRSVWSQQIDSWR